MIVNFKARLVEIPKTLKEKDSKEFIDLGKFTLNKQYRVYSVYSDLTITDFLVADDTGMFYWINMPAFRK